MAPWWETVPFISILSIFAFLGFLNSFPPEEVCDMLWEPTASLFQGKKRFAGYNSKGEKQPTWRDVWVVSIYNQTRETWSDSVFSVFHDESFHQKYPRSHSGLG